MVQDSTAQEIQSQYQAGQRDFQNLKLRRADFHGLDLQGADFTGTDFSDANLRDINLTNANLSESYLNGADLSGANLSNCRLKKASLLKTYLIKANLENANLEDALCTGAYLTRTNLGGACLNGSSFIGANLTGANFSQATYNSKTRFDATFNLEKAGLKKVASKASTPVVISPSPESAPAPALPTTLSVDDLLLTLNHLSQLGNHYLGHTMAQRYWLSSRPKLTWFEQFIFDKASGKVTYTGSAKNQLTPDQIGLAQEWAQKYVKSCALIFKDFPKMIEEDQLTFPVI